MSENPHPNNFYSNKVGRYVPTAEDLDTTVNHLNNTISETRTPTRGGTGIDTYTEGDIIYSDAENSLAKLPKPIDTSSVDDPDNSDKKFLKGGDNPSWEEIEKNEVIGLKDGDSVEFDKIENTEWEGNKIKLKYGGTNYSPNLSTETSYKTHQGAIIIINDQETYDTNAPGENASYTALKLKKGEFLVGSVTDVNDEGRPNVVLMNGDATMDENALVTVNSSTALEKRMDSNSHIENGDDVNEGRILSILNRYYNTYGSLLELDDESSSYYENIFLTNSLTEISSTEYIYLKYSLPLPGEKNGKRLTIRGLTFNASAGLGVSNNIQVRLLEIVTLNTNNSVSVTTTTNVSILSASGGISNSNRYRYVNFVNTDNPKGIRIDTSGSANGIVIQVRFPLLTDSSYSSRSVTITPPTVIYNYT